MTIDVFFKRYQHKIQLQDSCWVLTQCYKDKDGYPIIGFNKRRWKASRLSYLLHNGEFDESLCVLHTCDVRGCINPDHLFLGTQADNVRDMVDKKRNFRGDDLSRLMKRLSRKGEKNNLSKLSESQVIKIREDYKTVKSCLKVGRMYGVSAQTINNIIRGISWKHI